jgi:hypothetical protein
VCASCGGCAAGDAACLTAWGCDLPCEARCADVYAQEPLTALSLDCLAQATTCEEWRTCLGACGD